jgi:alcohol dehydrogenase
MKQQVIHTSDTEKELKHLINQKKFRKLVLVKGSHFELPWVAECSSELLSGYVEVTPPDGLLTVSSIQDIIKKLPWQPDLVIALGGGRILDAAKILIHLIPPEQRPFFAAVPTTAGSGSEATPFAVAYEGRQKISIQANALLADMVILDDGWLSSLPSYQRAVSGIDALAQSIESIWNVNATEASLAHAKKALQLAWHHLENFVYKRDKGSDIQMLNAAYAAGEAIAITRTTGCHALSYYLTAHHNVPHGQAVGFFLPAFFIYNSYEGGDRLRPILEITGADNAISAFESVSALMRSCGLFTRFSDAGLQVDIEALLDSVNEERFSNNPVAFDRNTLNDLIEKYIQ